MKKQRVINIVIYILLISVILFLSIDRNKLAREVSDLDEKYLSSEKYESEIADLNNKIKSQDSTIKELTKKIEGLNSIISYKDKMIEKLPKPDEIMLADLKDKGIDDLIKLAEDLMKHPELIPYKGSLGGKMGFFSTDHIYVLTDKWVLAYFEDGHTCGYMLLSYDIVKNKDDVEIKWKVLDSYLY